MILVRSPLRITLGGGGTDLPSYARRFGGFCLTAAIDQYVYVAVTKPFEPGIRLKYSALEQVARVEDVQHPIIREALRSTGVEPPVEIVSLADVPAGTGLGSSSAFTVALLAALWTYRGERWDRERLAVEAWDIESDRLNQPIGWQDQYATAFGGLLALEIPKDGPVRPRPAEIYESRRHELEDNLLLFYTGKTHDAAELLADQHRRTQESDPDMIRSLHLTKELGEATAFRLGIGDMEAFAICLDRQWSLKRDRSPGMSTPQIDKWFESGRAMGALGGKLVGAGGGGFLLFYTEQHRRLRVAMSAEGLREVRFRFDWEGTKVLIS